MHQEVKQDNKRARDFDTQHGNGRQILLTIINMFFSFVFRDTLGDRCSDGNLAKRHARCTANCFLQIHGDPPPRSRFGVSAQEAALQPWKGSSGIHTK